MSVQSKLQWFDYVCSPTLGCDGFNQPAKPWLIRARPLFSVSETSDRLDLLQKEFVDNGEWPEWPLDLQQLAIPIARHELKEVGKVRPSQSKAAKKAAKGRAATPKAWRIRRRKRA